MTTPKYTSLIWLQFFITFCYKFIFSSFPFSFSFFGKKNISFRVPNLVKIILKFKSSRLYVPIHFEYDYKILLLFDAKNIFIALFQKRKKKKKLFRQAFKKFALKTLFYAVWKLRWFNCFRKHTQKQWQKSFAA